MNDALSGLAIPGTSAQPMKIASNFNARQGVLNRLRTNAVAAEIGHRQVRLPQAATGAATEVLRTG